ncbi:nucleotide sugar dehydrogenase [Enterococcus faecium]|uniref:nucleotide sugar dehydrogenase n=1 Tax=Enterococcus faecium TaxID=1352 RepID=UPI000BF08EAF|nr:nucleotide sugar dehydrogenase [Enterococcus faecium]PEH49692.1 UDP-N-acetyl-D-mannosamine dehydrogenase [Enterococcus faecium]
MKISVLGLGYIGLPTAVMFANHDQQVIGYDTNSEVLKQLAEGKVHIEEPGLQAALEQAIEKGNFSVSNEVQPADVYIISVPTPNMNDELKSCDLSYVQSAVKMILPVLKKGSTVIIESTIAPRSMSDKIQPMIEGAGFTPGEDIFLVHCPERVLPGKVLEELVFNNRIIGGITPNCTEKGKYIYGKFVKGELLGTSASVAELSKLMENTYRDVNIALANELVKICDSLEINALEVIELANKHPRVNLHTPGPGVGGHCLAVDPYFIAAQVPDVSPLIQISREINTSMPNFIVEKSNHVLEKATGNKVVVMGLTYKGNIDDIRESPALEVYNTLKNSPKNYDVVAYDPHVQSDIVENNLEAALKDASLVLILVDHDEFKNLVPENFNTTKNAIVIDAKNIANQCIDYENYYTLGNISQI